MGWEPRCRLTILAAVAVVVDVLSRATIVRSVDRSMDRVGLVSRVPFSHPVLALLAVVLTQTRWVVLRSRLRAWVVVLLGFPCHGEGFLTYT